MPYLQPTASTAKILDDIRSILNAQPPPPGDVAATSPAAIGVEQTLAGENHAAKRDQVLQLLKTHGIVETGAKSSLAPNDPPWRGGINSFTNELLVPDTLEKIKDIVVQAGKDGKKVRVIGAAHSSPPEVILGVDDPNKVVLVSLTKYRGVTIDPDGIATVKAGTNLGCDPQNPDSTIGNSFTKLITEAGWALPSTGGMLHQAIGGFLQTGSSGGSLKWGVSDTIIGFTVVTGTGEVKRFMESDTDKSGVYAGGISMGLFGIVVEVSIKLEHTYYVQGTQQGYDTVASKPYPPPVDIFANDSTANAVPNLSKYFSLPENEYCRMLWWPQRLFDRLQIWTATRVQGTPPVIVPYVKIPEEIQRAAKGVLAFIWQANFDGYTEYDETIAYLLSAFVSIGPDNKMPFCDEWYKVLPMDNEIVDNLLPTAFTELFFDGKDVAAAMQVCQKLHATDPGTTGNFAVEMYAAKESKFWLSPSCTGDKVRIDVFFSQYATEKGSLQPPFQWYKPETLFRKYWDALDAANIQYTSHWGKYRPESQCKVDYLRKQYPHYDEWIALRDKMDPDQIFVSPYWKNQLQIQPKV